MKKEALESHIYELYVQKTGGIAVPTPSRIVPNSLKNEVAYRFGVPLKKLKNVNNLRELVETTHKNKKKKSDYYRDLINELKGMLPAKYLIQDSKINSNTNFIRSYFSGMFCF